ncbi:MAG: TRAP transporter substrate-binding protein [Thermodesulfobacteriota bacterium]
MYRILAALLGVFLLLAVLAPGAQAQEIQLSYANFPPAGTFPSVQMERWVQEVQERTEGKVQIDTFPGGALLGAKNMFRGVTQGQADIGCLSMAYQPGVFPLTSVLELPLGFSSAKQASKVLWELYQKHQPEEFAKVKVLTMFTSAPSNIMSKKAVRSLEDLQGLELRASGTASRMLEELGATPVSMPMPETPEALQKGVVQGLLSSLEVLQDLDFAAYCPYVTMTELQVYPFAVVMNQEKWESLPQDVQQVMQDLAQEQALWTGRYMDEHVQESLEYAKNEHQVQVFDLSQEDQQIIRERTRPVVQEWKEMAQEKGLDAEKVLQDVRKLRDEYAQE